MFEQTFKNIGDILHKDGGCTSELDYTEQSSWLLFLKYLDALEGKSYSFILADFFHNKERAKIISEMCVYVCSYSELREPAKWGDDSGWVMPTPELDLVSAPRHTDHSTLLSAV